MEVFKGPSETAIVEETRWTWRSQPGGVS